MKEKSVWVLALFCLILSLSGCTKITSIPKEDFIRIAAEELGIDKEEIEKSSIEQETGVAIVYMDPDTEVIIGHELPNASYNAKSWIELWNNHTLAKMGFDGEMNSFWMGSSGYSLFSGVSEKIKEDYGEEADCIYGGLYVADGQIYRVYTIREESKGIVDQIISKAGFPKP